MPKRIHKKCLQAMVILDFFGWNQSEIANALNLHRHTVSSHLATHSIYTSTNLDRSEDFLSEQKLIFRLLNMGMSLQRVHSLFQHKLPCFSSVAEFENYLSKHQLLHIHSRLNHGNQRKCRHCGTLFLPDCRHRKTQKFCSNPPCRKASQKSSQQKWCKGLGKNYWKNSQ